MGVEDLSFSSGLKDGLNVGFGLLDRIDAKRRREKQDKRAELLFGQSQDDRKRRIQEHGVDREYALGERDYVKRRRGVTDSRGDEDYAYIKRIRARGETEHGVDREYTLGERERVGSRREVLEGRDDELWATKRDSAIFGLERIKSQEVRAKAQEVRRGQAENRAEVQRITAQAMQMVQSGDMQGAIKLYQKADGLSGGYLSGMARGDYDRFADVAEQVTTGKMKMTDPVAVKAARDYVRPMMKQTGRYADYTFNGFERLENGRIALTMKHRKTGKVVPATMAQTSDKDDPIVSHDDNQFFGDVDARRMQGRDFRKNTPKEILSALQAMHVGAGGKLSAPAKKDGGKWHETKGGKGFYNDATGELKGGAALGDYGVKGLDHVALSNADAGAQTTAIMGLVGKGMERDALLDFKSKLDGAETYKERLALKDSVVKSRVVKGLAGDLKGGKITGNDAYSNRLIEIRNKLVAANIPAGVIDGIAKEAVSGTGTANKAELLKRIEQEVDAAVSEKRRWKWYGEVGKAFLTDPIGVMQGTSKAGSLPQYIKDNPSYGSKASDAKAQERLKGALGKKVSAVWKSPALKNRFAHIESRGNKKTRRKNSKYYGKYQFDREAVRDAGGDWAKLIAEDKATRGTDKPTPYQDALLEDSLKLRVSRMKNKGIPITEANVYLSHQQGVNGLSELFAVADGRKRLSRARRRKIKANGVKGSTDRALAQGLIDKFTDKYNNLS